MFYHRNPTREFRREKTLFWLMVSLSVPVVQQVCGEGSCWPHIGWEEAGEGRKARDRTFSKAMPPVAFCSLLDTLF